jgi:hypothetical protein
MKLNRQKLGTGLLIAVLATACAPQVKVKGKATVPAVKDATTQVDSANGQKSANEILAAQMMKDPALISYLKDFQTRHNVDCVGPRSNQTQSGCSDSACGVMLDITCMSRYSAGTDASAPSDNNVLYRISIPGQMDVSKNVEKWSIDQAVVKTLTVKAEDWKAAAPTTSNASSTNTQQAATQPDSQS